MMRLLVVCLVTATLLWPALAQAPDASPRCIDPTATDPSFEPYPETWSVLFDTWNYESLLVSGGVLQARNLDGEGGGWTGQQSTCREQLRVCDYRQDTQPQNNWVFTQYIRYLEAKEVNVDVTYDYTSCATNRGNGCTMLNTTMYLYERNGADNSARTNPNNYLSNELQVLSAEGRGTFTRSFTFQNSTNINGFYLGVQDTGTCGNINRITVYYRICPGRTDGLVTFPETPLPPVGTSQPNNKTGTCAANSSPTNPIYRAFADGRCETSGSCDCDSGFRLNGGSSCVACPAGTYRSASDPAGSCLGCPEKTDMTRVEAPSCACLLGYYRTAAEGAGVRCTTPPSPPSNLRIISPSDTTITIGWNRPASPGGRENIDLYYIIEYRQQGSLDSFMRAGRRNDNGNVDYTYTVMNLEPFTNYLITVTAENGVSDQEPDLRNTRTVEIPAMTAQGVPGCPSGIEVVADLVLVWQEPEEPNGVIVGYDVRVSLLNDDGSRDRTLYSENLIPRDTFFDVLRRSQLPANSTVFCEVRANTSAGPGEWCDVTFDTADPTITIVIETVVVEKIRNVTITEIVRVEVGASSGVFDSDAPGYCIVAVISLAVGAILTALIIMIIICCCRKHSNHKKSFELSSKNAYEI